MLHAINSRETERYVGALPRTFTSLARPRVRLSARKTRAPRRAHQTYAFGDFEFDEARFELRRHGVVVVVQPKALRLLSHLIVHRDRAVAADELFAELWPDERVSAASIKRAVLGARRALGESGESQRSIRTVRGYGYQFALPARIVSTDRPAPSAAAPVLEGARVSIELAGVTRSELADMLSKFYGSCLPEAKLSGRVVLCLDQPAL
jgi:DNA-binding winged helix-turn-helix (wHTH) protein